MILNDTVVMMNSESYKERFKAEYVQLAIRMQELRLALKNYPTESSKFSPTASYDLLNGQLKAMNLYASYLQERAHIESIKLG